MSAALAWLILFAIIVGIVAVILIKTVQGFLEGLRGVPREESKVIPAKGPSDRPGAGRITLGCLLTLVIAIAMGFALAIVGVTIGPDFGGDWSPQTRKTLAGAIAAGTFAVAGMIASRILSREKRK